MKNISNKTSWLFVCLYFLIAFGFSGYLYSQETSTDTLALSANGIKEESFDVSYDLVNRLKKDYTAQSDIPEEDLTRFNAAFDQIIKDLDQIKELQSQKEVYLQMQKNAPTDREQLEAQLAKLKNEAVVSEVVGELTLPEAESKLAQKQLEFNNAKQISSKFDNEPQRRAKRTTEIPEAISKAIENLSEFTSLNPPADTSVQNALPYMDYLKRQAKKKLYTVQVGTFQEELKAYEAAKNVLPLRRELAAKILANAEKQVEFWQDKVNEIRKKNLQQVKQEAQSAAQQVKYSNDAAKEVVAEITRLTEVQATLIKKDEEVTEEHKKISSTLSSITADYEKTLELIKNTEKVSSTMGIFLKTKKDKLPETEKNVKNIKERFDAISSAQLELHKIDSQISDLFNLDSYAEQKLADINITKEDPDYERYLAELKPYLQQKKNILNTISESYYSYQNGLAQLDAEESDLIEIVDKYTMLIEKNVLWIKSSSSFEKNQIKNTFIAFKSLLDKNLYMDFVRSFAVDVVNNVLTYSLVILLAIIIFGLRFSVKSRIMSYADKIKHASTDRFLYTIYTLVLSTFAALPVVLLLSFVSWRYSFAASSANVSMDFYPGLKNVTIISLSFFLLRWYTMPDGLCTHLKFDKKALQAFRKNLLWFYVSIGVLTFLYSTLDNLQLNLDVKDAGLRSLFIIEQVFVTIFLIVIFNPKGSILGSMQNANSGSRIHSLTRLWFIFVIAIPFVFCIVSIVGYISAARHLQYHLAKSLLFFLAVLFVNRLILRSLYVSRRRLVLAKYKQQKEETQEKSEPIESNFDEIHDSILNLSKQSRQIINVITTFAVVLGIWWIWKSTLPALEAIEQVKLIATEDSNGKAFVLSLGSAFKAIIIVVLTVFTAKNIPALLEIFILQKLEIPTGTRFASTTMVKYIISIAGIVSASSALGLSWEKVQWLLAAVSVGLGFGLQEIFANFISGLIILFEQPIRVGDYVTIGDVSGIVSQIKIRATTIVKWDRKELLVPNKEFVTGRLINWTLTDEILRIDFKVGVAYGSDIKKVEETLFKIARACKKISQEDPKPKVIFTGFGDSTLDFELRVYITDVEDYLKVWHKINCDIDTEFRKNNIEIAFPQRDLHLRTTDIKIPISVENETKKEDVVIEKENTSPAEE